MRSVLRVMPYLAVCPSVLSLGQRNRSAENPLFSRARGGQPGQVLVNGVEQPWRRTARAFRRLADCTADREQRQSIASPSD